MISDIHEPPVHANLPSSAITPTTTTSITTTNIINVTLLDQPTYSIQ